MNEIKRHFDGFMESTHFTKLFALPTMDNKKFKKEEGCSGASLGRTPLPKCSRSPWISKPIISLIY